MNIIQLITIISLLIGCNSIFEHKSTTTLETTLSAYRTAMRWGYWEQLFSFYNFNTTESITVPETVRVTAYEVLQPPIFVNEDRAIQIVEIQYVLNNRQVLHKILDKQDWRYDDETNLWHLHSSLPKFY